ncbi:MAG: hypothetical protein JWR83_2405 [Aeromicrobium sp.]|nr:hypothetical protein [Aeromicrobium sp.]
MSAYLFPDNTVLCNFASVERLDLLRTVLNGRGRWTEAVAYEASNSARFLPTLAAIATDGWLEEPIEITADKDIQLVNGSGEPSSAAPTTSRSSISVRRRPAL